MGKRCRSLLHRQHSSFREVKWLKRVGRHRSFILFVTFLRKIHLEISFFTSTGASLAEIEFSLVYHIPCKHFITIEAVSVMNKLVKERPFQKIVLFILNRLFSVLEAVYFFHEWKLFVRRPRPRKIIVLFKEHIWIFLYTGTRLCAHSSHRCEIQPKNFDSKIDLY